MFYPAACFAAGAALVVCDLVWLMVMWKYYSDNISRIQGNVSPNICRIAAIPIYGLMLTSVILVAAPLYPEYGIGAGALVGGTMYGIYNLCLVLQFEEASTGLAIVDTLWGTALFTGATRLAVLF